MRFVLPVMNVQLKPMDGAFAAARQQNRDGPLDPMLRICDGGRNGSGQ